MSGCFLFSHNEQTASFFTFRLFALLTDGFRGLHLGQNLVDDAFGPPENSSPHFWQMNIFSVNLPKCFGHITLQYVRFSLLSQTYFAGTSSAR